MDAWRTIDELHIGILGFAAQKIMKKGRTDQKRDSTNS